MRLLTILALGVMLIGLHSCSEDFTVAAPYRSITTVAGILDQKDTAHYIRIQKAFMDENKSAIEMSKEPDSSFYQNLEVTLLEYNAQQTAVIKSTPLTRVDLSTQGYFKEDPLNDQQFFTSPNYAYKFIDPNLNSDSWYRLIINNKNNNRIDSSEFMGVVNTDSNLANQGFYVTEFIRADYTLSFARTTPAARFKVRPYMPKNARMAEGFIRFHYVDKNVANNTSTRRYVDFRFDDETGSIEAGKFFELIAQNTDIYSFLRSEIGPAPDNVERYLDSCDVFVYAASPELYYNSAINLGQSSGLTSDNIQPTFSNFIGNNVIGVLGSRGMRSYKNAGIDKVTIDSLMASPQLESLRIRGVSPD